MDDSTSGTIANSGTVSSGEPASTITAKESIMTRVKALLSGAEAAIEHDEAALVAWIKAHL
jgi:hypothetical protein